MAAQSAQRDLINDDGEQRCVPCSGLGFAGTRCLHDRSVSRTARRSPTTSNSVHPTSCPFTRRGKSLLWWYVVSTMEPLVRFSRSPKVKFPTGRSNASVQGSQGRNSPGSRSGGWSAECGAVVDFASIIGTVL